MRKLLLTVLLVAIPASLAAQRGSFANFSGRSGFSGPHFGRSGYGRAAYYPLGLFDSPYANYLAAGYPVAAQPPVIIAQSASAKTDPEPTPPTQPLMIELQDNRYVQISGDQRSASKMIDLSPVTTSATHSGAALAPVAQRQQPSPAVLIFRDGHRQEVSAYTIADGALYAAADYATTGVWNQKIELNSLNIPETVALNSSRGLSFQLPAAPNEVIVGP